MRNSTGGRLPVISLSKKPKNYSCIFSEINSSKMSSASDKNSWRKNPLFLSSRRQGGIPVPFSASGKHNSIRSNTSPPETSVQINGSKIRRVTPSPDLTRNSLGQSREQTPPFDRAASVNRLSASATSVFSFGLGSSSSVHEEDSSSGSRPGSRVGGKRKSSSPSGTISMLPPGMPRSAATSPPRPGGTFLEGLPRASSASSRLEAPRAEIDIRATIDGLLGTNSTESEVYESWGDRRGKQLSRTRHAPTRPEKTPVPISRKEVGLVATLRSKQERRERLTEEAHLNAQVEQAVTQRDSVETTGVDWDNSSGGTAASMFGAAPDTQISRRAMWDIEGKALIVALERGEVGRLTQGEGDYVAFSPGTAFQVPGTGELQMASGDIFVHPVDQELHVCTSRECRELVVEGQYYRCNLTGRRHGGELFSQHDPTSFHSKTEFNSYGAHGPRRETDDPLEPQLDELGTIKSVEGCSPSGTVVIYAKSKDYHKVEIVGARAAAFAIRKDQRGRALGGHYETILRWSDFQGHFVQTFKDTLELATNPDGPCPPSIHGVLGDMQDSETAKRVARHDSLGYILFASSGNMEEGAWQRTAYTIALEHEASRLAKNTAAAGGYGSRERRLASGEAAVARAAAKSGTASITGTGLSTVASLARKPVTDTLVGDFMAVCELYNIATLPIFFREEYTIQSFGEILVTMRSILYNVTRLTLVYQTSLTDWCIVKDVFGTFRTRHTDTLTACVQDKLTEEGVASHDRKLPQLHLSIPAKLVETMRMRLQGPGRFSKFRANALRIVRELLQASLNYNLILLEAHNEAATKAPARLIECLDIQTAGVSRRNRGQSRRATAATIYDAWLAYARPLLGAANEISAGKVAIAEYLLEEPRRLEPYIGLIMQAWTNVHNGLLFSGGASAAAASHHHHGGNGGASAAFIENMFSQHCHAILHLFRSAYTLRVSLDAERLIRDGGLTTEQVAAIPPHLFVANLVIVPYDECLQRCLVPSSQLNYSPEAQVRQTTTKSTEEVENKKRGRRRKRAATNTEIRKFTQNERAESTTPGSYTISTAVASAESRPAERKKHARNTKKMVTRVFEDEVAMAEELLIRTLSAFTGQAADLRATVAQGMHRNVYHVMEGNLDGPAPAEDPLEAFDIYVQQQITNIILSFHAHLETFQAHVSSS